MRRARYAEKSCDWENYLEVFLKDARLSTWASVKVRECYNEVEVEVENGGSVSILRRIFYVRRRNFLRSIIAPSGAVRGVTLSYVRPHCLCFPLEDNRRVALLHVVLCHKKKREVALLRRANF